MARSRSRKRVPLNQGANIPSSKTPRVSPSFDSGDKETPVWLVGDIDLDGPFGWREVEKDLFIDEILPKIRNFERMTWGEILGRRNHAIPISHLSKAAKKRLQERKLDDIEELVSLHLTGLQRVWGIRSQRELRLLWWDPDHGVCPSHKKHT